MNKLPTCCEFHHKVECSQRRNCPVDAAVHFAAECEEVMPMPASGSVKATPGTHYCEKSRQPCATPYTCSTACKLVTKNTDGSSPHKPRSNTSPTVRWFAVLIVFTALAALCVLHVARIFYFY